MSGDAVHGLTELGFSTYEAKAYLALLRKSPVSGYELSKLSGVPRSMIYEVAGKLVGRGAALTLRLEGAVRYAALPGMQFIEQLRRESEQRLTALRGELAGLNRAPDLDYVWNLEGHANILAKAAERLDAAKRQFHLALVPETIGEVETQLKRAIRRGVRAVVYTTRTVPMPGAQVVVASMPEQARARGGGAGLILVVDGREVLLANHLGTSGARASWTSNALIVFIAEHHMRTDPYLPEMFAALGRRAAQLIRSEDRELFVHREPKAPRG
jgi:sugar-specific transcriptional regulator TrmB